MQAVLTVGLLERLALKEGLRPGGKLGADLGAGEVGLERLEVGLGVDDRGCAGAGENASEPGAAVEAASGSETSQ